MPAVWKVAEPLEVEYRQPIHQSSDQKNSGRKDRRATLLSRVEVEEGSPIKWIALIQPYQEKYKGTASDMGTVFQAGTNKTQ